MCVYEYTHTLGRLAIYAARRTRSPAEQGPRITCLLVISPNPKISEPVWRHQDDGVKRS